MLKHFFFMKLSYCHQYLFYCLYPAWCCSYIFIISWQSESYCSCKLCYMKKSVGNKAELRHLAYENQISITQIVQTCHWHCKYFSTWWLSKLWCSMHISLWFLFQDLRELSVSITFFLLIFRPKLLYDQHEILHHNY